MASAGLCATLVGLGLARFAYTPLIPALIAAGWFTASQAVYLGAANLAGYLVGALAAKPLSARLGTVPLLRGSMMLVTLACLACAVPLSFGWYLGWRFLSGIVGALVMILAAPTILPHVAVARRGRVGGIIFVGVGLGIAASGTLVPLLLRQGLATCWIGLAALAALLTAASWANWPREGKVAPAGQAAPAPLDPAPPAAKALAAEYGLIAFALVPHMVFLVDYVARQLAQGIAAGARYWVLYGLGAVGGPLLLGFLADRTGFGPALRVSFLLIAVATLAPALGTSVPILAISSLVVGAFTPGVVPVVLGRVHELIPSDSARQRSAWSRTTIAYAVGQAVGAYGLSILLAEQLLPPSAIFALGGAAAALALALDLAGSLKRTPG